MQGKLERADGGGAGARLIPAHAGKTTLRSTCNSPSPAHPRACGENYRAAHSSAVNTGSSPRVRGKLAEMVRKAAAARLIPARAGKTPPHQHYRASNPAHPRACGENGGGSSAVQSSFGSSPRVRGKLHGGRRGPHEPGLIPARAGKTCGGLGGPCSHGAHPRACGENRPGRVHVDDLGGSSPRVRGKPPLQGRRGAGHRLIPACAGKTEENTLGCLWPRAHPRACGENPRSGQLARSRQGSSPRVRGKQPRCSHNPATTRLIPARAGKTDRRMGRTKTEPAHPRACGENSLTEVLPNERIGSSPRVRGKPRGGRQARHAGGLIPACAGKTPSKQGRVPPRAAHPRACGENSRTVDHDGDPDGSSPRVRGKLGRRQHGTIRQGLIPARAGKTRHHLVEVPVRVAHPRACGENWGQPAVMMNRAGSSPRVRGKRHRRHRQPVHRGLIPARAGKTPSGRSWRRGRAAHPRACGENVLIQSRRPPRAGSSPRVRGKPPVDAVGVGDARLIPARAGKTC